MAAPSLVAPSRPVHTDSTMGNESLMIHRLIETYRTAYQGVPRAVWMNSIVLLIARCGTMVLPFLCLYCTKDLGMEPTTAGWLLGIYGAGGIIGGLLGGWLTQKIGSIPTQILSLGCSIPVFLVTSQLRDFTPLACSLFLLALVSDIVRPAAVSTTIEFCERPDQHTKALAVNRLAVNLGMTVGPAIGGFLALINFQLLYYVNAASYLGAMLFLGFYFRWGSNRVKPVASSPEQENETSKSKSSSPLNDRIFVLFWILTVASSVVFFQVLSTYPLFLKEHYSFNEAHIGLLLAVNTVVIVLFELVLVQYVARFSMLRTIAWGYVLCCLGFGLLPLAVGSSFMISVGYCIFTIMVWSVGEMLSIPLSFAFVAKRSNATNRGKYMGWYVTSWSLAAVLAPILGTWIYQWSPHGLWYLIATMSVALGWGFYRLDALVEKAST